MIFNFGLENIFQPGYKWNLKDRLRVGPISTTDTRTQSISSLLSNLNYLTSIETTGNYIQTNSDIVTISNITDDSFTISTTNGSYGLGMPYLVKANQQVKLKITATANNSHLIMKAVEYGVDGLKLLETNLVNDQNFTTTISYTVANDSWLVLTFAPYKENENVIVSNISLSIR